MTDNEKEKIHLLEEFSLLPVYRSPVKILVTFPTSQQHKTTTLLSALANWQRYIIIFLMSAPRGKQLVLFPQESWCSLRWSRGKHQNSRENKTKCFPKETDPKSFVIHPEDEQIKGATSRYFESFLQQPKLQFKCWES